MVARFGSVLTHLITDMIFTHTSSFMQSHRSRRCGWNVDMKPFRCSDCHFFYFPPYFSDLLLVKPSFPPLPTCLSSFFLPSSFLNESFEHHNRDRWGEMRMASRFPVESSSNVCSYRSVFVSSTKELFYIPSDLLTCCFCAPPDL